MRPEVFVHPVVLIAGIVQVPLYVYNAMRPIIFHNQAVSRHVQLDNMVLKVFVQIVLLDALLAVVQMLAKHVFLDMFSPSKLVPQVAQMENTFQLWEEIVPHVLLGVLVAQVRQAAINATPLGLFIMVHV